jgi:hypothetical protein
MERWVGWAVLANNLLALARSASPAKPGGGGKQIEGANEADGAACCSLLPICNNSASSAHPSGI